MLSIFRRLMKNTQGATAVEYPPDHLADRGCRHCLDPLRYGQGQPCPGYGSPQPSELLRPPGLVAIPGRLPGRPCGPAHRGGLAGFAHPSHRQWIVDRHRGALRRLGFGIGLLAETYPPLARLAVLACAVALFVVGAAALRPGCWEAATSSSAATGLFAGPAQLVDLLLVTAPHGRAAGDRGPRRSADRACLEPGRGGVEPDRPMAPRSRPVGFGLHRGWRSVEIGLRKGEPMPSPIRKDSHCRRSRNDPGFCRRTPRRRRQCAAADVDVPTTPGMPEFRDPKTGQSLDAERNVGRRADRQAHTADLAFDPLARGRSGSRASSFSVGQFRPPWAGPRRRRPGHAPLVSDGQCQALRSRSQESSWRMS